MIVLKRSSELDAMRTAGRIAGAACRRVADAVRPGIRLLDLDKIAEDAIRAAGAAPSFKGYEGFPASICTSVNDEVVHGIPSDRRLREGDIVSIDLGAFMGGYHGDTATTVPVGEIRPEVAELLEVTREALRRAIGEARPGRRLSDISHAVEDTVAPHGYGIVKELVGHGIGREMHEDPQIPNYGPAGRGPVLREGMTLAIEPMINLGGPEVGLDPDGWTVRAVDGRPSAHFEHTVAVLPEPEILTVT